MANTDLHSMKKLICLFFFFNLSLISFSQQPPGTEIYLLDLTIKKSKVTVANPQNITQRVGYDNQPHFHPDKPIVYYSSANAEGRTDLLEYTIATKQMRNITNTPEREYSPTVTPDKKYISCIIQRDNRAQDLGKYPVDGGKPVVLIDNLIVGYHAWMDEKNLLLFVLGDTLTLRTYNLDTKKDVIVAKNIGRSLHRIPNTNAMSFVHKISAAEWSIKKLNENGSIETITSTVPAREDLAWTSDGKILMSDGKKLFYFEPGKTTTWQEIDMPASMPPGTITRLAINAKGDRLAIVVSE